MKGFDLGIEHGKIALVVRVTHARRGGMTQFHRFIKQAGVGTAIRFVVGSIGESTAHGRPARAGGGNVVA